MKNIKNNKVLLLIIGIMIFSNIIMVVNADTPKDFSRSSEYAKDSINFLYSNGVILGDEKGNFNPEKQLTRAEAIKIIIDSAGIKLNDIPSTPTFKDVPVNHWAYKYVETGYKLGITKGLESDVFGINGICTREQIASFYTRALGMIMDKESNIVFAGSNNISDFKKVSNWAKPYVEFMEAVDLIKGDENRRFMPKDNITREQMAVITDRFIKSSSKLNTYVDYYNASKNTQIIKSDNKISFASPKLRRYLMVFGFIDKDNKEYILADKWYYEMENEPYELWGDHLAFRIGGVVDNGPEDKFDANKTISNQNSYIFSDARINLDEEYNMVFSASYESPYGMITYKVKKNTAIENGDTGKITAVPISQTEIKMYVPYRLSEETYKNKGNYVVTEESGNKLEIKNIEFIESNLVITLAQPVPLGSKVKLEVDGLVVTNNSPNTSLSKFTREFVMGRTSYQGLKLTNIVKSELQKVQYWSAGPISIFLNSDEIYYLPNPVKSNGELLVPLKVFGYLEYASYWFKDTEYATVTIPGATYTFKLGELIAYKDVSPELKPFENPEKFKDNAIQLGCAPAMVDNQIMLPFGVIMQNRPLSIYADQYARAIYIKGGVNKYPSLFLAFRESNYYNKKVKITIESTEKDLKTNSLVKKETVNLEGLSLTKSDASLKQSTKTTLSTGKTTSSSKDYIYKSGITYEKSTGNSYWSIIGNDKSDITKFIKNAGYAHEYIDYDMYRLFSGRSTMDSFKRVGKVNFNGIEATQYTQTIDFRTNSQIDLNKQIQYYFGFDNHFISAKNSSPTKYIVNVWVNSSRRIVAVELNSEAQIKYENDSVYGNKTIQVNGKIMVEHIDVGNTATIKVPVPVK